jgi:hypothetical protein
MNSYGVVLLPSLTCFDTFVFLLVIKVLLLVATTKRVERETGTKGIKEEKNGSRFGFHFYSFNVARYESKFEP